jgi:hypothetical protein
VFSLISSFFTATILPPFFRLIILTRLKSNKNMLLFNQNPAYRAYQLYTVMPFSLGETASDYCPLKNY